MIEDAAGTARWTELFRAFHLATDPRKLILALTGLLWMLLGLFAIFWLVSWVQINMTTGETKDGTAVLSPAQQELDDAFHLYSQDEAGAGAGIGDQIQVTVHLTRWQMERDSTVATAYWLVIALWTWFVWAFWGGAIARIAAVETATEDRISIYEATHFVRDKFRAVFWSPMMVVVAAGVLALGLVVLGLIGSINVVGPWVVAILMLPALIAGFAIAWIALGGLLGLGMMPSAVGAEGSDAFDAVSRTFSYVFIRPLHWLLYNAISVVYGVAGHIFVLWFLVFLVGATLAPIHAVMGDNFEYGNTIGPVFHAIDVQMEECVGFGLPMDDRITVDPNNTSVVTSAATWVGTAALLFVIGMALVFPISFLFSAQTLVYFLLRNHVDGTPMDEVYLPEDPAAALPPDLGGPAPGEAPGGGESAAGGAGGGGDAGDGGSEASDDGGDGDKPAS